MRRLASWKRSSLRWQKSWLRKACSTSAWARSRRCRPRRSIGFLNPIATPRSCGSEAGSLLVWEVHCVLCTTPRVYGVSKINFRRAGSLCTFVLRRPFPGQQSPGWSRLLAISGWSGKSSKAYGQRRYPIRLVSPQGAEIKLPKLRICFCRGPPGLALHCHKNNFLLRPNQFIEMTIRIRKQIRISDNPSDDWAGMGEWGSQNTADQKRAPQNEGPRHLFIQH